jgi:hypothetical protein
MALLLYELLWAGNDLGVEGAKLIAKTLESNHNLTTLDLIGTSRRAVGTSSRENKKAIWQSFSNCH